MNFKSYKVLFALVAIVFSLASCKKKEEPKPSIVGFWQEKADPEFIIEFSADGSVYSHELNEDGSIYTTDNSTYKLEGDKIIWTYSDGKSESIPYKLEGDQLTITATLTSSDGQGEVTEESITRVFTRVPGPTFK